MKLQLKLLRKVNWQNYKKLLVKMVKEQLIIKFLRTKALRLTERRNIETPELKRETIRKGTKET